MQSIISVAGHQVIRNLSEPSEFTMVHLDIYADYVGQGEPRTESRAVRALPMRADALPMRTDYEETTNPKKHRVKDCQTHSNQDLNGLMT